MLRLAPALTVAVLVGPVLAGLAGVFLPAFGYFPALGGETFSLEPWRALVATPGIARSAGLSLWMALATSAISLTLVLAFVAGWSGTRLFSVLRRLLSPLLSVPHAAAAFGLAFLIAPSGWIMRLLSPWATGYDRPPDVLIIHDPLSLTMMLGLIAKEVPFLFLMVLAALPQTDAERLTRVTSSFGYGRMAGWMKAVLPRLYPQIRLPLLAVIVYASSVVDVALILGPTRPPTLAVQLTRWMNDPDLAMRFKASAGAMLQLGVTASAILIWLAGERIVGRASHGILSSGRRRTRDGWLRAIVALLTALLATLTIGGMLALVPWSLAGLWPFPDALPEQMTLTNWTRTLPQAGGAIAATLSIALGALVCAGVLTLGCLENEARTGRPAGRRALGLVYIPLLVPQVAFLFGLQFLFLLSGIGTSWIALVASHFLFVLPYMFLSLRDPWRAWDMRYAHVAASLGARPARIFWRIRLPMLLGAVLTAAAVGFAVSVGQYLPTLLIGGGRWATVTTEAVALSSGGNRRLISIYALIQMALPFAGFAIALGIPALLYRNRTAMKGAA